MTPIMANYYRKKRGDDLWKELLTRSDEEPPDTFDVKPTRGGKREGAGRPKGSTSIMPMDLRIRFSVRLPRWIIVRLNRQEMQNGRFIEQVLRDFWLTEDIK